MKVTTLNKLETTDIEMNFYVFCDDACDGGRLEKFNTFEEAQNLYKKDISADAIILGINITELLKGEKK